MAVIRKALTLSEYLLGAVCVLFMAAMVVMAAAAVFFRFVVNSSLAFPDEMVAYLFVWTVFLGSAVALRHNMHAAVEMAVNWLPPGPRRYTLIVANLLCIAFFVVLLVFGIKSVITVHPQISPALEISMSYVYAAVPVGALFMLLFAIEAMLPGTPLPAATEPQDL
ncbi:MAG: TRAP transporter small permease [Pseudolabrys sp.]|nr:TRAP transporter small permease [Pseudolabrys sp.]